VARYNFLASVALPALHGQAAVRSRIAC
jgi:hypothetical protein